MIRRRILSALAATVIAAAAATPAVAAGEPKNQPPFTRPVQSPPTVVVTNPDDGFSWVDAAIGAAAGVGATCAAGALAALAWTTRRTAIAQ